MQPSNPTLETTEPATAWWLRWLLLLCRLTIIALAAAILTRLPLPLLADWLPLKNVVISIVAVGLGGKCLFDTLFYDRFWA